MACTLGKLLQESDPLWLPAGRDAHPGRFQKISIQEYTGHLREAQGMGLFRVVFIFAVVGVHLQAAEYLLEAKMAS